MAHEPSGLVGHAKHSVELMGAHSLLGRHHHPNRHKPFVERDMGAFKDRPNRHRELPLTRLAPKEASASRLLGFRLRRHAVNVDGFAMGANRAVGPEDSF
ncbi:MAG TPA: hypothetical protein VFA15_03030, partial [Nitrososphaera sp.]|nr:hypothetical protein [Nitrososphaera sp.]